MDDEEIESEESFDVLFDSDSELPETPDEMSSRFVQHRDGNRKQSAVSRSPAQQRVRAGGTDKYEKIRGKHHQPRQTRKKKAENQDDYLDSAEEDKNEAEASDPEEKLCSHLQSCLAECSRQRLRALQMSLRHYGTVDNRVSYKDMQTSLQENQIKLSHRALQMLTDLYQDSQGIDFSRLHLCMDRAHLRTGRDSVKARNKRNDLETKQAMTVDQIDKDFLRRLEELLVREHTCFDIDMLRTDFSKWDHHRLGKIDKEGAFLICDDKTPLYGSLLKSLLNRCDEDKDSKVSWPLLLNFLEKAQASAWESHPELSHLPEKLKDSKANRIVTPEPLDELSSSTRSKVMSKLMKKARRSPLPPKTDGDQQAKESETSETGQQKDAKETTKTSVALPKEVKNDEVTTPKDDEQSEEKARTEEDSIKRGDENRDSKLLTSNRLKVAVPQGYHPPEMTSDPPKERLQLEWIYGYRGQGQTSGSRPHVLASGEVAYFIACTVVLYNSLEDSQRHYREHTEYIRCMSVHSAGVIVASGQDAGEAGQDSKAHIRIWRCDTLATLHILGQGMFEKSVIFVAFMPGQAILVSCDNSRDKKLMIWNTTDGTLRADTFLLTEVVTQMSFNPKWPEILVTCGKEHLAWWKIYVQTETIQPMAKPNYEGFLKARYINCVRHNPKGDLITGDSNGTVYVWGEGGNKITNFVKHGHEGPVLDVLQYRGHLLTAGKDGALRCWTWDKNMDRDGELQAPETEGGLRSLLLAPPTEDKGAELVIGTTMNSLLGVTLSSAGSPLDNVKLEGGPITQGHTGELCAIARVAQSFLGADILTASTDGVLCMLNSERREPVWKLWLRAYTFSCVDSNERGDTIVLGTRDGHLVVLQLNRESLAVTEVCHKKVTPGEITVVKLSPDERMLAIGASDRYLHVFHLKEKEVVEGDNGKQDVEEEWAYFGILKGHSGPVASVDWSAERQGDAYILRSSTLTPEQKFWDVTKCEEISGNSLNDFPWASASCLLDHKLVGLWSSRQASEGQLTSVDVNPGQTIVAMATNSGFISLFQYPCTGEKAFSHAYKSHQSPVNLCFTIDGRSLLTVGGADASIMQWKIV